MRVTTKLTAAITAGLVAVLGLDAWVRIRREDALLRNDMEQDARLVARTLARAAERVWPDEGIAGAEALLRDAHLLDGTAGVTARWVWLGLPPGHPDGPAVPLDPGALGDETRVVHTADAVLAYAPITVQDPRGAAAVELREPLHTALAYERDTALRAVGIGVVLALLSMTVAAIAGARLVGTRVRRMAELARRVGDGDLSLRTGEASSDELGELGRELDLMCERLARALEQLRHGERLATAGRIAAGLAHELGTPLNVVGGRAQLILTMPGVTAPARDNARIIGDQVKRMTAIIRNLLDFTRRHPAVRTTQDLRPIARRTLELLRESAEASGARLVLDEPPSPLVAGVDAALLEQVLVNLVVNGIQAMLPAGGPVTLSLAQVLRARPGEAVACDVACLAVRDEGTGIRPEHRASLFEPFFTTKAVGEGTGLGLSVTRGIVVEHGGWIEVESEVGAWSRFAVYLPVG